MPKPVYSIKGYLLAVPEGRESVMTIVGRDSQRQAWWLEQQAKTSHCEPQARSRDSKLATV